MISWAETCEIIKEDYRRFSKNGGVLIFILKVLFNSSFCITFWFRIACYLNERKNVISKACLVLVKFIYFFNQRMTGIQVPVGTRIGSGLRFFHYNCIVIAYSAIIGKNCSIHQGVTIGRVFAGKKEGVPTIGNNVVIFPGAKVIGNINVGDYVVIGTNAVVVDDVPSNSIVAGTPAKIISRIVPNVSMVFGKSGFYIRYL